MCGRYDLNESPQMLALHFLLSAEPAVFSNADVRPTNVAPIIRIHEGRRLALPARWGLIPSWSKDDKIAQHTFNARGGTVAEKPDFDTSEAQFWLPPSSGAGFRASSRQNPSITPH